MSAKKEYFPENTAEFKTILGKELDRLKIKHEISVHGTAILVLLRTKYHYKQAIVEELIDRLFPEVKKLLTIQVNLIKYKPIESTFPAAATHRKIS